MQPKSNLTCWQLYSTILFTIYTRAAHLPLCSHPSRASGFWIQPRPRKRRKKTLHALSSRFLRRHATNEYALNLSLGFRSCANLMALISFLLGILNFKWWIRSQGFKFDSIRYHDVHRVLGFMFLSFKILWWWYARVLLWLFIVCICLRLGCFLASFIKPDHGLSEPWIGWNGYSH